MFLLQLLAYFQLHKYTTKFGVEMFFSQNNRNKDPSFFDPEAWNLRKPIIVLLSVKDVILSCIILKLIGWAQPKAEPMKPL